MPKCSKKTPRDKPSKPYPDLPIFPHASGRQAKKIRNKLHYFGPRDDPNGALERYVDPGDDLHAGRKPRPKQEGLSVEDACNHFLHAKRQQLDSGELAFTTWNDYQRVAKQVVEALGRTRVVEDLRGDDFDQLRKPFAKRSGLVRLANKINRARIIFKSCYDVELIDRPIRFGANFKRPSAKSIRRQRKPKMFEASAHLPRANRSNRVDHTDSRDVPSRRPSRLLFASLELLARGFV
ncbi:MAG: hypothetical protein ACODAD_01195 [Planctomycetota bacterium]